jgi:hypothetical protein
MEEDGEKNTFSASGAPKLTYPANAPNPHQDSKSKTAQPHIDKLPPEYGVITAGLPSALAGCVPKRAGSHWVASGLGKSQGRSIV